MSDTIEKAFGKNVKIKLKGKEYTLKPNTIRDYLAFKSHIKSRRINEFLKYAENLPPEVKAKSLIQLTKETISEYEMQDEINTPDGMTFMLWRALIKTDKDLTLEKTIDLIDDIDSETVIAIVNSLETMEDTEDSPLQKEN